MNFNFNVTSGSSQSVERPTLEGNKIHTVTFDGCEARDFDKRDGSGSFHVLSIKFHNANGDFTHTVWEPRDEDAVDNVGPFGKQPSNVLRMIYLFKHLIDAVNPELGKKIDEGTASLDAPNWDALRKLMVEATAPGVGTETKIKLIKNNKGEAQFPYFLAYEDATKGVNPRMTTNVIGNNVFFSTREQEKINKAESAVPTAMSAPKIAVPVVGAAKIATPNIGVSAPTTVPNNDFINMNFN